MQLFPVEYSSLSTTALLNFILTNYTIDGTASLSFMKRGFNDTYLIVANEKKWILRVYKHNWRNLENIKAEVKLLIYLKTNGIGISEPLLSKNKEYIHSLDAPEGVRYCVLFSYAPGVPVKKLSVEQAHLLGRQTAGMHLLTKNKELEAVAHDYSIEYQFQITLKQLQPLLVAYPKQFNFILELQGLFKAEMEELALREIETGICHGDLQSENFHVTTANNFTFFDFDFFGKGYLIYDIGVFMWYDHKNKPPAILSAFLEGYEHIRPLSAAEHHFIPWLSTLRALFQMTLYCKINDGKQLPLWPPAQVADFINKIEKWHKEKTQLL